MNKKYGEKREKEVCRDMSLHQRSLQLLSTLLLWEKRQVLHARAHTSTEFTLHIWE